MSLQFRRPTVLGTVALLGCLSATVRGESGQTPDLPPRALDVAADFARQMVTAGVVMCWPHDHEGHVPADFLPDHGPDKAACDELNASLFQRREGGVLHVRTTREPRRVTELLNRSIDLEAASDVQAIDAVMRVILNAVRGNGSSGAHSSSGVGATPVTIRGGRTTFMEALDDVVRQVPGSSGSSPSRHTTTAATFGSSCSARPAAADPVRVCFNCLGMEAGRHVRRSGSKPRPSEACQGRTPSGTAVRVFVERCVRPADSSRLRD